ncbi:MAG: hypothetical protein HOK89_05975, partial [Rhodospirillaceae bacterium]|nr:hypothetical protein [Rhodospirillaceae bacterium]
EYENNQIYEGSTSGWANNTWRHIAAVKHGHNLTLYVDGDSRATTTTLLASPSSPK